MIRLRSRKGVSGAISAMFVIAIFFIILVSLFVYTGLLNSYNQTVTDRNRMDWERDSESIFFIVAKVQSGVLNLNFSNDGGVTLHLVQVWLSQFPNSSYSQCTNQSQYWISKYVSSGQTVGSFGTAEEFKRVNIGSIGAPIRLSGLSGEYFKIKLVTERGNTFECQIPYPPPLSGGGGSGDYSIVISEFHDNFQYTAGTMTLFKSALIKPRSTDRTLYRVLLKNTTEKPVVLLANSTMQQSSYAGGAYAVRYIVDSGSTSDPDNLVAYSSQIIQPGSEEYVYFAATTSGGATWQVEPDKKEWYLVGFVVAFHYLGESETLSLPLPVFSQQLT